MNSPSYGEFSPIPEALLKQIGNFSIKYTKENQSDYPTSQNNQCTLQGGHHLIIVHENKRKKNKQTRHSALKKRYTLSKEPVGNQESSSVELSRVGKPLNS